PQLDFQAVFPKEAFNSSLFPNGGNIRGSLKAAFLPEEGLVRFYLNVSNVPTVGGAFSYHIHVNPVPSDGNCTKTLGHLDPFSEGEAVPCNTAIPEKCQVGDLSGKHGPISVAPIFQATYDDRFIFTSQDIGAYFRNRSIVIHQNNKARITCANLFETDESDTQSEYPQIPSLPTPPLVTVLPPTSRSSGSLTLGKSIFSSVIEGQTSTVAIIVAIIMLLA
ncbi:superoxide dismutase, partial [Podospora didyma]